MTAEHFQAPDAPGFKLDPRVVGAFGRFAGGAGTYPLVGTPQRIADDLVKIAAQGYQGAALSFVNYVDELPGFAATVLPLLREAGLRSG